MPLPDVVTIKTVDNLVDKVKIRPTAAQKRSFWLYTQVSVVLTVIEHPFA